MGVRMAYSRLVDLPVNDYENGSSPFRGIRHVIPNMQKPLAVATMNIALKYTVHNK